MNSTIRKLVIVITLLGSVSQLQAAVKVYVPLGAANEILVIDGDRDEIVGRIGDVMNAHGLAVTPDGNYLVAGSMSLAPKDQKIPEGMTADEHNAHHPGAKGEDTKTSYGTSFVSLINTEKKKRGTTLRSRWDYSSQRHYTRWSIRCLNTHNRWQHQHN